MGPFIELPDKYIVNRNFVVQVTPVKQDVGGWSFEFTTSINSTRKIWHSQEAVVRAYHHAFSHGAGAPGFNET